MKINTLGMIAALVATALLPFRPALHAQDKPADKPGKPADRAARSEGGGQGGQRAGASVEDQLNRLTERLQLTDEQMPKFKAALADHQKKLAGLRDAPQDQRREKLQALREEMKKKLKAILTNEQYESSQEISQYIRRILRDSKGNVWFGTNNDGVCRLSGETLDYFTVNEGLSGNQVTGILEDKKGNIWLATSGGVSRYDGKSFVNFTMKDGQSDNKVWSICEDKTGVIWAGTVGGACRFTGNSFAPLKLPVSKVENPSSKFSSNCVWAILEDRRGNLWFGMDGVGAWKYDGHSFVNYTEKDGLCNNRVASILEDRKGNMWFGNGFGDHSGGVFELTGKHTGGVSRYDGKVFRRYSMLDGMSYDLISSMIEDQSGKILFAAKGVDIFDGKSFFLLNKTNGFSHLAVQSIFEYKKGHYWIGTGGGLYRYDGNAVVNVTKDGPWD